MRLTKDAKRILRKMNITMNDVHMVQRTCYGDVYSLYNPYFLTEMNFYGYSKQEIYHKLVCKLFKQLELDVSALE